MTDDPPNHVCRHWQYTADFHKDIEPHGAAYRRRCVQCFTTVAITADEFFADAFPAVGVVQGDPQ